MELGFFKKSKPADGGKGSPADGKAPAAGGKAAAGGVFKKDPHKAGKWFRHALAVTDHDYAIDNFLNGFKFEPDRKDMHETLREVALKRKLAGGKPAGFMEKMKSTGKDPISRMLDVERTWAKDPRNVELMATLMERAGEADAAEPEVNLAEVVYWLGTLVLEEASQPGKKVSKALLVKVRDLFKQVEAWDKAIEACRLALRVAEEDADLLQSLRDLEAQQTLTSGGYDKAGKEGAFKDMVRDFDKQRILDHQDRAGSRTEAAVDEDLARRRAEFDEDPRDTARMEKLVDALRRKGGDEGEAEATRLLREAWEQTGQYKFKMRAGDIEMRMHNRQVKEFKAAADARPADAEARKKYHEAARTRLQFELQEFTERVKNYPTDTGLKFELGKRLYAGKKFDEAIAVLQEAQSDPKLRPSALQYLGLCYTAKGWMDEAVQTFRRGIEAHKFLDDELAMNLRYLLQDALEQSAIKGRSLDQAKEAQQIASQLLQVNINYRDIRLRLERIQNLVSELQKAGAPEAH